MLQLVVVERRIRGCGTEQKDTQIRYGDTRRTYEQLFPCSLERMLRVAVIEDTCATESSCLQQNPCYGYVICKIYTRDGCDEQH